MTVKEQIAEIIRANGYDFLTALQMADDLIKEFLDSNQKEATYYLKNGSKLIPIGIKRN